MRNSSMFVGLLWLCCWVVLAGNPTVNPGTFDPAQTSLVSAAWVPGAGCPTGANVATYPATTPTGTYTDAACTTGDPKDKLNEGLLLVKTGPTSNNAAPFARILTVKGTILTELGYDIRNGTHCGAGAPRFNITTTTGKFYFLGCTSPAPDFTTVGTGWTRLRWSSAGTVSAFNVTGGFVLEPIADPIDSITIVFDEAQDTNPVGLAVLDNIDINGFRVGKGPDK